MTHDPDLAAFVRALRVTHPMHAHIQPTPDEAEVADLIEELDAIHARDKETCTGCAERWPCKGRLHAEELGLLWTGRAHARYTAHMSAMLVRLGQRPILIPIDGGTADPRPLTRPARVPAVFPAEVDTERQRLSQLREIPATPASCRYPDCRTVISVPHPLADGWLHDVVCAKHKGTTASRYTADPWLSVQAAAQLTYAPAPGRCASCRAPISSKAEWCCEPCATGTGHADTCKARRVA